MPAIRMANQWGKRPTAAITQDDWFGHRDPFTGEPYGDKDEWTQWDYSLSTALQVIEDHTDDTGLLVWEREDDAAHVNAIRKVNKFQAQVQSITGGKNYKPRPGEYFVPEIYTRKKDADGNQVFQTYREWVEKEIAKEKG